MSFHPHSLFHSPAPTSTSFTPLFRLLEDFDTYTRATPSRLTGRTANFVPKFDVKELPSHYELQGELAGIDQRDVTIEFTDPQTLSIRGKTERTYTEGTPPAGVIEAGKPTAAITEGQTTSPRSHRQASVEDEDAPASGVAVRDKEQQVTREPEEHYWVSERSVGSFARSFSFPGRVDQDGVTASMKNGILSVIVPKAKKHESRRIEIA